MDSSTFGLVSSADMTFVFYERGEEPAICIGLFFSVPGKIVVRARPMRVSGERRLKKGT